MAAESNLTELGMGAIFALMILKEVFAFLKTRKSPATTQTMPKSACNEHVLQTLKVILDKVEKIQDRTDDLHEWHNITDPTDGTKIWYVKKSLEDTIGRLSDNIATQTQVLQGMLSELKDSHREIDRIETAIKDVKDNMARNN